VTMTVFSSTSVRGSVNHNDIPLGKINNNTWFTLQNQQLLSHWWSA